MFLTTVVILVSISVSQIDLPQQGESFPQTKIIQLPVDKKAEISFGFAHIEGDISNSAEPSLARPFRVKEDLQFGVAKEFAVVSGQCNGTISISKLEDNRLVLSILHQTCPCGSFIDFIGDLRYEIGYGTKGTAETKSISGTFRLSQRNFIEHAYKDPFDYVNGFDKKTKILLMNSDYSDSSSCQSLSKRFPIIGGHRYKIQFVYAIPDTGSKSTQYNLLVKLSKYQRSYSWTEHKDIKLKHSRMWRKFEIVIKTCLLSSDMLIMMNMTRQDTNKDFGEILIKDMIIVPLDGFREQGP